MRDLIPVVARDAAKRFLEKRALSPALIGTALQTPGFVEDGMDRYRKVWHGLNEANREPLGSPIHGVKSAAPYTPDLIPDPPKGFRYGPPAPPTPPTLLDTLKHMALQTGVKGVGTGLSEGIKYLFAPKPGFMERKDIGATIGQDAIHTFSKGMADAGMTLLKDMASKAMSAMQHAGDDSARRAILQQLKQEDSVLATADDKALMEAYHTMVRFAPTLSTDKNAVRNFLREAIMTGSGPNFATIKMLGETERTVTGQGRAS